MNSLKALKTLPIPPFVINCCSQTVRYNSLFFVILYNSACFILSWAASLSIVKIKLKLACHPLRRTIHF